MLAKNLKAAVAGQSAGGYTIDRSLRFNSADSAYLNRTPGSAGNRKTWTWSGWVKRSKLDTFNTLFCGSSSGNSDTTFTEILFRSDQFQVNGYNTVWRRSSALYRDVSAWYHVVVAFDTTQATAANRVKLYVNGSEVTSFSISNDPTQNTDYGINQASPHSVGSVGASEYYDGYMADVNFIDGQALDPSYFGEYNADTGVWQPIEYTGTYGTNGFHLDFSDNSSTSALGTDSSGNGNNWTANNFSVTAGAGNDSLVDTPTQYGTDTGAGGEVGGNYATWNPLNNKNVTLTNGNLNGSTTSGMVVGTIAVSSGKWYWECTPTDTTVQQLFGIISASNTSLPNYPGGSSDSYGYYATNGNKYNNSSSTAYGASYGNGDVIGVALDLDAGTIVFYKNGVSQGTAYSGISGTFAPAAGDGATNAWSTNFGQRPFAYTAPSGFKALCTTNLPEPDVVQGNTAFSTVLWTGDGASSKSITGVGFQPDLVWHKIRSASGTHGLYDAVRGAGKKILKSQSSEIENNGDENSLYGWLSSFDADGFTFTKGTDIFYWGNQSGSTYAAWNWKAGGSGVSNTDGSITSTVSANPTAGISVVTFTAPSSNTVTTIGHGLGAAPSLVIVKPRSVAASWQVYHSSVGNTKLLKLDTADAASTASSKYWNNTSPTSSVFTIMDGSTAWWDLSATHVAYCFAQVEGFSAIGSYTGNGSTDGPFVYTGFRPAFFIVKATSVSGEPWKMWDSTRNPYNVSNSVLWPSLSNAEFTGSTQNIDIVSNGFKFRMNDYGNTNGVTYIYMAFAENPFKYSLAR